MQTDCVAVCHLENGAIGVTNSSDPDGKVLVISRTAMADWVESIKVGMFDDLV